MLPLLLLNSEPPSEKFSTLHHSSLFLLFGSCLEGLVDYRFELFQQIGFNTFQKQLAPQKKSLSQQTQASTCSTFQKKSAGSLVGQLLQVLQPLHFQTHTRQFHLSKFRGPCLLQHFPTLVFFGSCSSSQLSEITKFLPKLAQPSKLGHFHHSLLSTLLLLKLRPTLLVFGNSH